MCKIIWDRNLKTTNKKENKKKVSTVTVDIDKNCKPPKEENLVTARFCKLEEDMVIVFRKLDEIMAIITNMNNYAKLDRDY